MLSNNSGSNYLKRIIARCEKCVLSESCQSLAGRANYAPKDDNQTWTLEPHKFGNEQLYDWPQIRELMYEHWTSSPKAKSTPRIFFDTSQHNSYLIEPIKRTFENSYFIFGLRDPYCFCLSEETYSDQNMARHWLNLADNINKATSKLPADIYTFLNYEQLDDKPTEVERTVINLVPELYDFRVLGFRNGNAKHHSNLKTNLERENHKHP